MLRLNDTTKDHMFLDEMSIGETFKNGDRYYIVMRDEGEHGGICCYDLVGNQVVEFSNDDTGTVVEIECVIKGA